MSLIDGLSIITYSVLSEFVGYCGKSSITLVRALITYHYYGSTYRGIPRVVPPKLAYPPPYIGPEPKAKLCPTLPSGAPLLLLRVINIQSHEL